jgi:hypothetical protein
LRDAVGEIAEGVSGKEPVSGFRYPDHDQCLRDALENPARETRVIARWLITEREIHPFKALEMAPQIYLAGLEIFCLRPMTMYYLDDRGTMAVRAAEQDAERAAKGP